MGTMLQTGITFIVLKFMKNAPRPVDPGVLDRRFGSVFPISCDPSKPEEPLWTVVFYKIKHYWSHTCSTAQGVLRFSFQPLPIVMFHPFLLGSHVPAVLQGVMKGLWFTIECHSWWPVLGAAMHTDKVLFGHPWGGTADKGIPSLGMKCSSPSEALVFRSASR